MSDTISIVKNKVKAYHQDVIVLAGMDMNIFDCSTALAKKYGLTKETTIDDLIRAKDIYKRGVQ